MSLYELMIFVNVVLIVYTVLVLINPDKFMPFINYKPLVKRIGICVVYGIIWICFAFFADGERKKMKIAEKEAAEKKAIAVEKETQRILNQSIIDDSIALSKGDYYKMSSAPTENDIDELLKKHNHISLTGGAINKEVMTAFEYIKAEEKRQWDKAVPAIRKAFVANTKTKLWIDDINVYDSDGGKTIWFVGGIFAANRNKQAYYERYKSKLMQLEFKKVCFKWIEHDTEYTCYTLD